jgi:hypothetical protein
MNVINIPGIQILTDFLILEQRYHAFKSPKQNLKGELWLLGIIYIVLEKIQRVTIYLKFQYLNDVVYQISV